MDEDAVLAREFACRDLTKALKAKDKAEREFIWAILEAHDEGLSLREIAIRTQYSHQRIHQIVQGARQGAHPPESVD